MKALIKVGYACNEHCSFCHTLEIRHIDGSTEEVDRKIHRAARLGHTMVVLSGGEPTIRPELMHWARLTASLGLDFGLVTNGQMLAYPDVVDRLVANRLRYVYLSLHGGTPKVHNLMVRSDAFDNAFAAVRNLSGRGLDFSINCVITRHNVEHLKGLVDLLLPYPDITVKFSMVEPKGGGDKLFRHLMPRVEHVAKRVHEAITYGLQRAEGRGPRFTHGAIPLCLLPGYEDLFDDLKTHQYRTMIEVGEPDFFPVDDRNKTHTDKCRGCALQGPCPGLYKGYEQEFGDVELRPVIGRPRSNSFNYRLEGRVSATAADRCPLLDGLGVTPWDRGRSLFVKNGTRLARYRADSRDFSDGEIETIKHTLGQLYVDVSRKDAPDDFARDLVQLRRSALCDGCAERNHCTGLFEPVLEDVFSRDDQQVRALLATLRGDVLDVGCGEGPYAEILEPLAREGRIRYVGVDPERARIETLRARWPWAELHARTAESLAAATAGARDEANAQDAGTKSGETTDVKDISVDELASAAPDPLAERRFDHILVLRSWNHLRDPSRALDALCERLRPGGTLTIVDNVAFGLARSRAQTRRGENSRAELEHYRNHDAADAHALASRRALTLIERRDVGPTTSNQWLLRYARAEE